MKFSNIIFSLAAILLALPSHARELRTIDLDDVSVEVRVFEAKGDTLLLGFACDEGKSVAEERTAQSLSEDGIEVWMPDLLSAYMLPDVRSSLNEISSDTLVALIDEAMQSGKKVYLIASGPDTELILRAAHHWENIHKKPFAGAVLLFPRLFKSKPEPGTPPVYVDAVGTTHMPIVLLEGERTPNQWTINHLVHDLQKHGSQVFAKLIPSVRGYFFNRQDANRSEEVVTSQLAGLIKVSLFYLDKAQPHD